MTINDIIYEYHLSVERAKRLFTYCRDQYYFELLMKKIKPYKIWTIFDQDFPILLRLIPDPPLVLYGLGKAELIHQSPSLAVVGTRVPSPAAKRHINQLLKPLVDRKWTLVSGMALGIDGYAHRLAHYYNGQTIAVLAGGLEHPYPPDHLSLYRQLTIDQLVISEYPPDRKPERYQFPERNRLISGLAFATLVVEAKEKSGSLITADQALEQGREVFSVPGSISQTQSIGCHKLIQNGAKLVQNTYDILEEWEYLRSKWCRTLQEYRMNN